MYLPTLIGISIINAVNDDIWKYSIHIMYICYSPLTPIPSFLELYNSRPMTKIEKKLKGRVKDKYT